MFLNFLFYELEILIVTLDNISYMSLSKHNSDVLHVDKSCKFQEC